MIESFQYLVSKLENATTDELCIMLEKCRRQDRNVSQIK